MKKPIKAIVSILVVAAIIAAGIIFVPRLTHTCDNCGGFILGSGYKANVVSNTITSLTGQEDKVLCKECAAKEHSLAIAAGKSLEDFKRPLFEEKTEEN